MKKLEIHYLTLILCTFANLALCQIKNDSRNLTDYSKSSFLITQKQADSCLKVNQAYKLTNQLLIVSEKEKNVFKNQANFFFLKADSLSLANEQLTIKFVAEKKAKRKAKFELWTERLVVVIAGYFILK